MGGVFTLLEGTALGALGLEPGGLVGRSAFEAYRGEPEILGHLCRALAGEAFASVVEVGGFSFNCLYNPLRNASGTVIGAVGFAVQDTGRGSRRVEDALVESEERYRTLVENVQEGVGLLGPGDDALVEYCNRAYAGVFGLLPDELVGRSFLGFLDEEDKQEMLRHRSLRREGVSSSYEVCATAADGSRKHLSCGGYPIFGQDHSYKGAVHTIVDVTEHRRAEAKLKESEECFRLAFEAAAVGMAHVAPGGAWIKVNDKLCDIVGCGREELLGLTFQDITHPDDLDVDLCHVERMLAGDIREYSTEKRFIRKDRSRVWIELAVSLVRDAEGEPDYFVSVVEDITERKLADLVPDPLTPRETQVLGLMAAGMNNPRIAKELAYSLGTVKLSVRCVLAKLGAEDRASAAAMAIEIGLVSPPPP